MRRALSVLAFLVFLLPGPAAIAGPPAGVSGRLVPDEVPELRAEVQRRERAKADPSKAEWVAEARARLAEAEGRSEAAAVEWRKVIRCRTAALEDLERLLRAGRLCSGIDLILRRGSLAEARYRLAEVERDRAAVAAELPKVVSYYEARLDLFASLGKAGAIGPENAAEERDVPRELRKARLRLDSVSIKPGPTTLPEVRAPRARPPQ